MKRKLKKILLLVSLVISLTISNNLLAGSICDDYIDNQWPSTRYTVEVISSDAIVTDNITGLMWKRCSEGLSTANCATGSVVHYTWQQALDIPVAENVAGFAGYTDWRLPNIEELRSLAAKNCYFPAINQDAFPNTDSYWYWSSSPYAENTDRSWILGFSFGDGTVDDRDHDNGVRLVRSNN